MAMTREQYLKFHRDMCDRMIVITTQKNADYCGDSPDPFANFSAVEVDGITTTEKGFLVRMRDKWSRIIALVDGREARVRDEAIEDTLLDLANYSILLAGYLRGRRAAGEEAK